MTFPTPQANRFHFRTWNKENHSMQYLTGIATMEEENDLHFYEKGTWGEITYIDQSCGDMSNLVVMQSTGLLDRNGKEIFEGDIVKGIYEWELYNGETAKQEIKNGRIEWVENFGCWWVVQDRKPVGNIDGWNLWRHESSVSSGKDSAIGADAIEIIGNTYETPHLLPKP